MIGNPRYGPVGLLALPFFLLFELLGPVVELARPRRRRARRRPSASGPRLGAGAMLVLALARRHAAVDHRRSRSRSSPTTATAAAATCSPSWPPRVVEHLGFRWAHSWYRLRGLVAALTRRNPVWTAMPRLGFSADSVPAERLAPVGPWTAASWPAGRAARRADLRELGDQLRASPPARRATASTARG